MNKLIKIFLSLFLLLTIIINSVLSMAVLAIENNVENATYLNSLEPMSNLDSQLKQTMFQIESGISDNNSDVISELQNQFNYYSSMLDDTDIDEISATNLIDATSELMEKYNDYVDSLECDVNVTTYATSGSLSLENITYEALVAVTVAGFFMAGMNLAAELLTYAWFNEELESVYYPIHGDDVMESTVFSEICSNEMLESDEYKFSKKETINDIDLYLAIHKFKYTKSASGRTIVIHDRYDFEELDFEELETFVDYGLYAAYLIQEANIIVPFNPVIICNLDGIPYNDSKDVIIDSNIQYYEDVATLGKGEYKDYNLTFTTSGIRTIQTFGSLDAVISIYDDNGILLDTDDDSGYLSNSFIQYNFEECTEYTIRVNFYDSNQSGAIKLGIIPVADMSETESICIYEDIYTISSNVTSIVINEMSNQGGMYQFIPPVMSNYVFETPCHCNSYICLIDPRQTYYISYNDEDSNSGDGSNSYINKELGQSIPYLIVCYVDFTSYVHEYSELICTNTTDTDHTYGCIDCGYSVTSEHNMRLSTSIELGKHGYKCYDCGYVDESTVETHSYDYWAYLNTTTHIRECGCGARSTETASHAFKISMTSTDLQICIGCGYTKKIGSDSGNIIYSTNKVSVNGSYIISDGTIMLVDEDIEAYENGTLVFYDKDDLPQTQ